MTSVAVNLADHPGALGSWGAKSSRNEPFSGLSFFIFFGGGGELPLPAGTGNQFV